MGAQIEMERREAPKLFRFERKGDVLEGVMCGRERITVQGKPVMRYTFWIGEKEFVTVLGTADIITKLRKDDVGHLVRIEYYGDDASVTKNGNAMRVFNVDVSTHPVEQMLKPANDGAHGESVSDGTGITDDDLPF